MNFCPCCATLVSVVRVFSSAPVLSLVSFPICPILINISSVFSPRIYTRIWHLPLISDSLVLVCHSSWVVCMSALTTVTFNPFQVLMSYRIPGILPRLRFPSLMRCFLWYLYNRELVVKAWTLGASPPLRKVKLVAAETIICQLFVSSTTKGDALV